MHSGHAVVLFAASMLARDSVANGQARSVFQFRNLARLETRAEVFASGRMLETDWRRSVLDPHFAPCLAASLPAGGKLMSTKRDHARTDGRHH
jgi:hypothetical protein